MDLAFVQEALASMDADLLASAFRDVALLGFLPGFGAVTVLHLIGYGIFSAARFLNISKW